MIERYGHETEMTQMIIVLITMAIAMLAYYSLFSYHGVI
jgi:hypothetical protein